jgi:hypothetical protein
VFHETIIETLKDLICTMNSTTEEHFWAPENEQKAVNAASQNWVSNFLVNSSFAKYFPHITLVRESNAMYNVQ